MYYVTFFCTFIINWLPGIHMKSLKELKGLAKKDTSLFSVFKFTVQIQQSIYDKTNTF